MQTLLSWVDLGVIAIKGYFTLLRTPEVELDHQMQFSVIRRTTPLLLGGGGLIPRVTGVQSTYYKPYRQGKEIGCVRKSNCWYKKIKQGYQSAFIFTSIWHKYVRNNDIGNLGQSLPSWWIKEIYLWSV